jgi:antitoxin component of RelBE/YafQ-DinJ toxin-antitoxin module
MTLRKKRYREFNRRTVTATIDEPVKKTLEMLGLDIPALIEIHLSNVANFKTCPCCGQQVKPRITGRDIKTELD